jgi:hypothetical protein
MYPRIYPQSGLRFEQQPKLSARTGIRYIIRPPLWASSPGWAVWQGPTLAGLSSQKRQQRRLVVRAVAVVLIDRCVVGPAMA